MTRRTRSPGRIFLGSLLLLACAEHSTPLDRVRVAFNPHISWAPVMIAQAEGFFRDAGIEAELVPSLRSEESLVAIITGDIDVRPGPLHAAFFSAIAQGARVRIVAGQGMLDPGGCTYFGIVLRPGIDSIAPPIRTLRASQDGMTRYVVEAMLRARGIDINTIETVRIPDPAMVPALQSGSLDGIAASEPTLSRLRAISPLWARGEAALPNLQWGVLAFAERLLTRDREVGARFLRAYQRGVDQFRQGKTPRNVQIVAEGTGEDAGHVRAACWPTFDALSRVNWPSLEEFQRWSVQQRLMVAELPRHAATDTGFARVLPP